MSDIEPGKRPRLVADISNFVKESMSNKAESVVSQFLEFTLEELEREFRGTTRNLWDGESYEPLFICAECHAAAQEPYEDVSEWCVYPFRFCPYCGRRIEKTLNTSRGGTK